MHQRSAEKDKETNQGNTTHDAKPMSAALTSLPEVEHEVWCILLKSLLHS